MDNGFSLCLRAFGSRTIFKYSRRYGIHGFCFGINIQHTPVVPRDSTHGDHTHNLVPELVEKLALKWFSEVVGDHLFGWAILNSHFLASDAIGNEKISNVNVPGSFATRCLTIFR
jgi:hypothetical protein